MVKHEFSNYTAKVTAEPDLHPQEVSDAVIWHYTGTPVYKEVALAVTKHTQSVLCAMCYMHFDELSYSPHALSEQPVLVSRDSVDEMLTLAYLADLREKCPL